MEPDLDYCTIDPVQQILKYSLSWTDGDTFNLLT